MLNVIALRPTQKKVPQEESTKPSTHPRHHVLTEWAEQSSGRLDCGEEVDVEVPAIEIYGAR